MDLGGEYTLPVPRDQVWTALNDPEVLKRCIVGCEELEKLSETEFTAKVTAKVGPVKARFSGKVTLSDIDPPNGYVIAGEGQGGAAGFAKGSATVRLADQDGGTVLTYEAQAQVGGKLAQIGSRLVKGTAKKTADSFFDRFTAVMRGEDPDAKPEAAAETTERTSVTEPAPKPSAAPAVEAATPGGGLPAWLWSSLLIAGVALLYALTL